MVVNWISIDEGSGLGHLNPYVHLQGFRQRLNDFDLHVTFYDELRSCQILYLRYTFIWGDVRASLGGHDDL